MPATAARAAAARAGSAFIARRSDGRAGRLRGSLWRLRLEPGIATVATAALATPAPARYVRLTYLSGQLQSNVWLAQAGVWARADRQAEAGGGTPGSGR